MTDTFMGLTVILDESFVEPPEIVTRTWRERLFTRPWHPFMRTRPSPAKPKFFVDNYHNRLYTCRRGLKELERAMAAHTELTRIK